MNPPGYFCSDDDDRQVGRRYTPADFISMVHKTKEERRGNVRHHQL